MDFKVLEKAAELLQDKLRLDESVPDIGDQFSFRHDSLGCHRYFVEPYKSQWGPMLEYGSFVALPSVVLEQCTKIECASFMGILPELERIWVTVDNKLFLWKYSTSGVDATGAAGQDCDVYDGMSEVIVSVALSAPKPGVFLDAVKYVLVVASPVEVVLLAVTCDTSGNNLKLVPTSYSMPSDNVAMVKVVGTQAGRIFMAGNDGNVYELDYSNSEGGWSVPLYGDGSSDRRKCRKINHFAWNWKLVHILPPFLKTLASDEDSLVDLLVDNVRNVMYAVTAKGSLSAFNLGPSGLDTQSFLSDFNLFDAARQHLSYGRGSEGSPKAETFSTGAVAGFGVLSLHVIPPAESKKAHVVAVLTNGIRIYLSLLTTGGGLYQRLPHPHEPLGNSGTVGRIEIAHVRSPPSATALRVCCTAGSAGGRAGAAGSAGVDGSASASGVDLEGGLVPSFVPSQALRVSSALYNQGVTLLSLDKSQHPDELVGLFEDLVGRAHISLGMPPAYQQPHLREGVCIGIDESRNGGKIYDVKESCAQIHNSEVSKLRSLFAHSVTPSNAAIRDASPHFDASPDSRKPPARQAPSVLTWLDGGSAGPDGKMSLCETPVVCGTGALTMATSGAGSGYDQYNLHNLAVLGELCWQHIPCVDLSTQRKFLVLTNQGVHMLRKLRPADLLYRVLSVVNNLADVQCQQFFSAFGTLEASAMCVALACGLPCDAGSSSAAVGGMETVIKRPLESIQMRAMSVLLGLTQGPTYKALGSGLAGTTMAAKDARVVIDGSSVEFVRSSAHDAMYLVCSRILRPVWLRPLVQRNKTLAGLWTAGLIAEVRAPLLELLKLLKLYFTSAVVDPKQGQDYLTNLSDNASSDLVTRLMLDQARSTANPEKVLQQQAKRSEDASLNALYRLVSKALQALSFVEVLVSVDKKWGVRVQWAKLGEISFRALVLSPTVHENVKKLVASLINDLARSSSVNATEQVIDWLSRECSFYFSAGDRCSYEAGRQLEGIQKQIQGAAAGEVIGGRQWDDLQAQSRHCVKLFLSAAQYWRSLDSVCGEDSELWRVCARLLELEQVGREGIVDICLTAAKNFSAPADSASDSTALALGAPEDWEQRLYRESVIIGDADRRTAEESCFLCLIQHILTVGSDVRRLGAGMVPAKLSMGEAGDPLQAARAAMRRMLSRAVHGCNTATFFTLLGDRLIADHQGDLLSNRSGFIEEYLSQRDPQLLYRYLEVHGESLQAANLMVALARDDGDVEIGARIANLRRAVDSAERAVACSLNAAEGQIMSETLLDLKDTLDIAVFQEQAGAKLSEEFSGYQYSTSSDRAKFTESQRRSLDAMQAAVQRVRCKLLSISELFHEVCLPYKLWDLCLLILHVSKHTDADLIVRLWRSFIYRLVPESGSSEESQAFLKIKRDSNRIDFDKRHQLAGTNFESAERWLPTLELQVVALAKQIVHSTFSASGATRAEVGVGYMMSMDAAAFPSALVLEELEEIAATLAICSTGSGEGSQQQLGWAMRCFYDIGSSHGTLVESYMEIFDKWAGKAPEKLLHVLASTVTVLLRWTRDTAEPTSRNEASVRQLLQAVRSGRASGWTEKLRRHASTLAARRLSVIHQELLQNVGRDLTEVNRRISEMAIA